MANRMQSDYQQSELQTAIKTQCPCCASHTISIFHRIASAPVNSVLNVASREEALRFPKGTISLGFCHDCGFIYNTEYDSNLVVYSSDCEESQGYSPTFNAFAKRLAVDLIEKHDLRKKTIVEIGCGKGEFLKLICDLGQNSGIGIDPAYVPGRGSDQSTNRLMFIKDYYSEKYANYHGEMICCRMTLEHIQETAQLVDTVRRSIGNREDTLVFFQVPDVTRILQECAFEDIYYEHCSYFSPGSLAKLFRNCRFDLLDLRTDYDGQYILIEAKPATKQTKAKFPFENDLVSIGKYVSNFKNQYAVAVNYWQTLLEEIKKEGKRTVVWGSGSKAVSFLTTLPNSKIIDYVVDINPHRQGTYMTGTGQAIVSPEFLTSYYPDVVIIMNPVYREEIQHNLNQLDLKPTILVLGQQNDARV